MLMIIIIDTDMCGCMKRSASCVSIYNELMNVGTYAHIENMYTQSYCESCQTGKMHKGGACQK